MERTKIVAVALVMSMLMSGCLSYEGDVEVPDVILPDDWMTGPSRTISSPQLYAYDDCDDLEQALKQSLEEEYRTLLLQAVAEQYYYGGGMWLEDAEMAMDDASASDGSANGGQTKSAPTASKVRIFREPTTKRLALMRPTLSKPTAITSTTFRVSASISLVFQSSVSLKPPRT